MSLKNNSFFNYILYKKEVKLLISVTVLATLLLMFTLPYGYYVYSEIKGTITEKLLANPNTSYIYDGLAVKDLTNNDIIKVCSKYLMGQLKRFSFTQIIIMFILPITAAALVMGQDRNNKSIDLIASMPFTRKQIFFSKVIAGLAMCIIPYLLILIVASMLRGMFSELSIVFSYGLIFKWFITSILPIILLFIASIFVGTLVSPPLGIMSITPIFLAFPIGLGSLIYLNLIIFNIPFELGFVNFFAESLILMSPAYFAVYPVTRHTVSITLMSSTMHTIIAILFTVVLLTFSYYLYKKHKMEYSNELLIYPQLERIFIIGVSVCCALITGPLMFSLFFNSLLAVIPGYALGAFIGGWLARYLVKIKKTG